MPINNCKIRLLQPAGNFYDRLLELYLVSVSVGEVSDLKIDGLHFRLKKNHLFRRPKISSQKLGAKITTRGRNFSSRFSPVIGIK